MVKVRIPATTANLGPGFDTLGMALNLYNHIEVEEQESGLDIEVVGNNSELISRDYDNIVYKSIIETFKVVGYRAKGLKIKLINEVPIARGLGSSAAAIAGAIVAANELSGNKLNKEEILKIASDIEGHPDNVAPALYGGLVISSINDNKIISRKIEIKDKLKAIVAIPDFTLKTKVAREVLPKNVSMKDAIFNISQTALLVYAFTNEDYPLLSNVMNDKLHQPYRVALVPGMKDVLNAALSAGALSVALSGAGPTLLALTLNNEEDISNEMHSSFKKNDIRCNTKILNVDNKGTIIV